MVLHWFLIISLAFHLPAGAHQVELWFGIGEPVSQAGTTILIIPIHQMKQIWIRK